MFTNKERFVCRYDNLGVSLLTKFIYPVWVIWDMANKVNTANNREQPYTIEGGD